MNVLVAVLARRRDRPRVLVRVVAAGALLRAVYRHGRRIALRRRVATFAVAGRVGLEPAHECSHAAFAFGLDVRDVEACGVVSTAVEAEHVTIRAVGLAAMAKALFGLLAGVRELAFLGVTRGAAPGAYFAHRALAHVVTLGTSDLLLDHVHAVTAHSARGQPGLLDVQASPVGSVAGALSAAA